MKTIADICICLVLAATASGAIAQRTGNGGGSTARGEITISASVAPTMLASGMPATLAPGDADASPCMWSNTATRGYTVTSDNAPVVWRDGGSGVRIDKGATSAVQTAHAHDRSCSDGARTTMHVERMDGRTAGTGGVTTITIAAQ